MHQCIHHLHSLLQYFLYCFSQKILNTRLKCFVKENKLWADLGFFLGKQVDTRLSSDEMGVVIFIGYVFPAD